jgi:hypothetical protein
MADAPELVSNVELPSAVHSSYSGPIKTDEKPSGESTEKILLGDPSPKYFVGTDQNAASTSPSAQEHSNSQFTSPTIYSPQGEAGCRPLAQEKHQNTSTSNWQNMNQERAEGEWTFEFWDMLSSKALCEYKSHH